MGKLIFHTLASIDGYVNDEHGKIDWTAPSAELLRSINDMERPVTTYLWGRRLYETMAVWEDIPDDETQTPEMRDFARLFRAAEKVVFSNTLDAVTAPRTHLVRSCNPDVLREFKENGEGDLEIGGATLAGSALRWGLVDEVRLHLVPVAIGGGTRALPEGFRTALDLVDHRRYADGTVFLRYRVGA
jgi:dihydrofolate reductase